MIANNIVMGYLFLVLERPFPVGAGCILSLTHAHNSSHFTKLTGRRRFGLPKKARLADAVRLDFPPQNSADSLHECQGAKNSSGTANVCAKVMPLYLSRASGVGHKDVLVTHVQKLMLESFSPILRSETCNFYLRAVEHFALLLCVFVD